MASRSLGTLTIELIAHIAGFQTGMDKAARIADERSRRIGRTMSKLKGTIAGAFAGITIGVAINKIFNESAKAETALAELESALKATGNSAGFTAQQLSDYADVLSAATKFDDESIIELQTTLLRFTSVVGDEFTRATELSLDLATALKIDLVSAGKLMGQALENPVRGIARLRKAGVELSEEQVKLIKSLVETGQAAKAQNVLMDELSTIQGRAGASADTFSGALAQVKNAFDNLFEVTGEGSDEAKEALQELRDVLRSEDTREGARILASGVVTAFATIVEVITDAAKAAKFFGEEFARMQGNFAADDAVGIQIAIDQIEDIKKTLAGNPLDRLRFFGKDGIIEWYNDAELDAELKRLKGLLDLGLPQGSTVLGADGRPTPGATNAGAPSGEGGDEVSKEFEKIQEGLNKQLALYGQVGEAAKVRYEVEHGLIEGITAAQGQRLIALAEEVDAQEAAGEAAKKKKEEEEKLQKIYTDQVDSYKDLIANVGELTELDALRFEIAKGTYGVLLPSQQQYLEGLAKEADLKKQQLADEKEAKEIIESLKTPAEEYAAAQEHLLELKQKNLLTDEELVTAATNLADEYKKQTEEVNEFAEQATRNVQDIMGNFLSELVQTGELSFSSLLKSFQNMIIDMIAQAAAAQITKYLFGAAGIGGGGGVLSGLFGAETGGWIGAGRGKMVGEGGYELAFSGGKAGVVGLHGQHPLFAGDHGIRIVNHDESEAMFRRLLLTSPSRDMGGRGWPGMPVRIGTGAQPEVYVPDSPGTFMPKGGMGGTQENHFHFSVQAPNGTVSRSTEQQLASAAARGIADAARRNN